jgi:hypothetical protein
MAKEEIENCFSAQQVDALAGYVLIVGQVTEKAKRLQQAHFESLKAAYRLAKTLRSVAGRTRSRAAA